jgi:hypothetical protein
VAVAESLGGQHPADDDHRGAADASGQHLRGDVGKCAAQGDFPFLAGVGDDGDRAAWPVVRGELGDDLLAPLHGQVQHQGRAG